MEEKINLESNINEKDELDSDVIMKTTLDEPVCDTLV